MSSFMFPSLVKRFLNWKQGDEEDTWRNKAVEILIKKLKRQSNDQYLNLQIALNEKNENTPCITLGKSQDGRLQVSHKKMLPHVMYCRIFRWPDLQSQHELRPVPTCQYPPQRRDQQNKICVNPYHYSRVDHSLYPPIVTPRNNEFTNVSPPVSPGSSYNAPSYSNPHLTPVSQLTRHQSSPPLTQENPNDPFSHLLNNQHQIQQAYQFQSPLSESNWYGGPRDSHHFALNVSSPQHSVSLVDSNASPFPGYSQQPLAMDTIDDAASQQTNTNLDDNQDHWCKISYAELNQKIGEPFKSSSPVVIVNGFTDPSVRNNTFSIGVLSNINRNTTIERTRQAIGHGVCLENNDAHIFVENMSKASIFFHSKNCNVENQLNQHAVVKIEPQVRQKIFDQKVFENLLQEAIRSTDGRTYERLFALTEHCIIKMSFVKGWGSIYQRQDVTSTPCWIEIHLLKPYALIDRHLRETEPPSSQITSTS